jgi:hypothetical protein
MSSFKTKGGKRAGSAIAKMKKANYDEAMRGALARKPFLKTDGCYLTRDEVHLRDRLR